MLGESSLEQNDDTLCFFGGTSLITHCLESFKTITKVLTHCSEWQVGMAFTNLDQYSRIADHRVEREDSALDIEYSIPSRAEHSGIWDS